jgi:hypothetical protein
MIQSIEEHIMAKQRGEKLTGNQLQSNRKIVLVGLHQNK